GQGLCHPAGDRRPDARRLRRVQGKNRYLKVRAKDFSPLPSPSSNLPFFKNTGKICSWCVLKISSK
ncbi:MAG: hypothetical protein L6437_10615, partial [Kiritimatiellae bacterium]|nr:hypothetical protein [Kiritimatiellia bacterium]